jgi:trk system potassium uptake protein TrkA
VEYDNDNLIEAGIKSADAVFAVSADDNINITVALIAKKIYNVPNIIARINDPNRKHIYQKLNIDAISPVQLSVDLLKNRLLKQSHDVIAVLDDGYEIIEFLITKKNAGSVKHFENIYSCIISAVIKDGKTYIPDRDEILKENDKVICTICNGNIVRLLSSYSEAV